MFQYSLRPLGHQSTFVVSRNIGTLEELTISLIASKVVERCSVPKMRLMSLVSKMSPACQHKKQKKQSKSNIPQDQDASEVASLGDQAAPATPLAKAPPTQSPRPILLSSFLESPSVQWTHVSLSLKSKHRTNLDTTI